MAVIPQSHTLTLQKNTPTQGSTLSRVEVWITVQTLAGSLQAAKSTETVLFNKETMTVDSIFLVEQAQFTSSANEALLKGSSRMIYGSRTFEIVGVKNWTGNQHLSYYRVQLKEVK